MKIRILKNCLVEIQKTRLDEVWDKQLYRGNELHIDSAIHHLTENCHLSILDTTTRATDRE